MEIETSQPFVIKCSVKELYTEGLGNKSTPSKREESGTNMPEKGRMEPENSLEEDEHGFRIQARKRAHKKRVYHNLLSRKADHYKKKSVDVNDSHMSHHMENYCDTEEEELQYGDPYEASALTEETLGLPQEDSTLDLDDYFRDYCEISDNRRKT